MADRTVLALFCAATVLLANAAPRAAVVRQDPEQKIFRSDLHPRLVTNLYAPKVGETKKSPVIFFSGEWGWRPLQQDTASYLASTGRLVLGIDGTTFFDVLIPVNELADDLAQFRAFANERAGRPRETPVILIGFAWGAEMIPYVLNQIGASDARGAVLIAPDKKGATRFRVGIQLKMDSPPGEGFDVEDQLRRMAPIPVVLMEGTIDQASAAKDLSAVPRGPHKYVPVAGGDRQFHEVRDGFFAVLADALRWIDNTPLLSRQRPGPSAAASPDASPEGPSPTPAPTAPSVVPGTTPPGD